jgi:hypothetical protein
MRDVKGTRRGAVLLRRTRSLLIKVDRPRAIDEHIDYFGGAGRGAGTPIDAAERFCAGLGERRAG